MRTLASAILCGVSLLSLATTAHAQATPAAVDAVNDTGDLQPGNEIIVSARRRDEALQDVPQTVNVVTAAQVEKLNLRNFTEIQNVVPGLQLQSTAAFSNQATVRGIAFVPEASGNNPSVEFYLNDAPISSGFLFQSTFDFGQFELQRGPQGTLRGRASPSGSIAVTTRRPDLTEVGLVANATITNLHARKIDGAFNIPIIADVLAVRLAGVYDRNQNDRVHSIVEGQYPGLVQGPHRNSEGYRATVRFEPIDWASFNVMYQRLHTESHRFEQMVSESLFNPAAAPSTLPIINARSRLGVDEQGTYDRQDFKVLIGNADFRFAGQRLSYVGLYSKQDLGVLGQQDSGNYYSAPLFAIRARAPSDPIGFAPVCANEVRDQQAPLTTGSYNQCTNTIAIRNSHEVRLASDDRIGGIFDYVIGGFHDHNNNPTDLTQETPILLPSFLGGGVAAVSATAIQRRGSSTEKSAFGNLVAHLFDDKLELSGGLRYIDFKENSALYIGGVIAGASGVPDRQHLNKTIYTGSVKYKITPDFMVYALTGSSFRPGPRAVGDFSIAQTALEQRFLNLAPESSKSYEVGVKTSLFDRRLTLNLSGYHQTFKNYPFRGPAVFYINTSLVGGVPVPSVGTFNFVSAVPVTVNGVEGEASFKILDRWTIGLNAAYADGKIKNGTIACTDLNRDGLPDLNPSAPTLAQLQAAVGAGQTISACSGINRRSAQSPKFSANVQSEFGFDITRNMDGFVRGLYSFFGKTSNDPDNSFDNVGKYGLLNLYAGIRDKDGAWEISLFGKNITAERDILTVGNALASTTIRTLQPPTFRTVATSTFSAPYRVVSVTAPREFGVNLRVAFGSR